VPSLTSVHDDGVDPGYPAHGLELAHCGAGLPDAWLARHTGAPEAKQQVDTDPPDEARLTGGPTSGPHDTAVEPGSCWHGSSQPLGSGWLKQVGVPVG